MRKSMIADALADLEKIAGDLSTATTDNVRDDDTGTGNVAPSDLRRAHPKWLLLILHWRPKPQIQRRLFEDAYDTYIQDVQRDEKEMTSHKAGYIRTIRSLLRDHVPQHD